MKLLKRIVKNESGQALPIALILLVLGGLLVVPTLSLVTTNLTANRVVDRANLELYAADAGVEEVLWNIIYDTSLDLPSSGEEIAFPQFTVNGRTVNASLSKQSGDPYKITSIATSQDGHQTTVECYLNAEADLSWLFDSAITSANDIVLKPGTTITGDVTYGDDLTTYPGVTINGDEIYDPDIADKWPSADYLSDYYYEQVDDLTPYPSDEISISGTESNPTLIGPLYRDGNLTLKGGGWAKLMGTVYVTGTLTVNPTGGCDLDLNNKTIFSSYYNNCSGNAIYLGPKTTLWNSGCIIAVGCIYFQPNLTSGDKLIGVNIDESTSGSEAASTFLLSRFQADVTGAMETFRVKCSGPGNVKVALYADSGGAPGALLNAVNDSTPVVLGWNDITDITFAETDITAGTYYWLAANSDSPIIYYKNLTNGGITKSETYSSFTFPTPAGTGFTSVNKQYLFAGHIRPPFVFLMSILCYSDVKPNGTLYGSIAGDAEVELYPGCTLTLTQAPDEGLDFPVGAGAQGELLTYIIK